MYDQIHAYLEQHYSLRWISKELGINFRTLKKYIGMSRDEYEDHVDCIGQKRFSLEPYKEFVVNKLRQHPDTSSAQMHDWLKEHYADFPDVTSRTVFNFVMKMRQNYGIAKEVANERQYSPIPDAGPGEYAQVDFGQKSLRTGMGNWKKVYFMVMLLCHSRYKFLWFSDRPFTSESAVIAHEKSFEYFRGVPRKIIYDQDAVFLHDENVGDYVMTAVFDSYVKSCPFKAVFCRPADPESKGKVENAVKYVKQNFLQNRQFTSIDDLNEEAVKWLQRTGNMMVHNTTCKVPFEEWKEECRYLLPYVPVMVPEAKAGHKVLKTNAVRYKSNTYTVPAGTYRDESSRVLLNEEKGTLVISDMGGKVIARHIIPAGRGNLVINRNHRVDRSSTVEQMRQTVESLFTDRTGISMFLDKVKEAYPRYMRDQLSVMLDAYDLYGRAACEEALSMCNHNRFKSANDFKSIASSSCKRDTEKEEEMQTVKPLGDASARMMANIEPNRSNVCDYDAIFNMQGPWTAIK